MRPNAPEKNSGKDKPAAPPPAKEAKQEALREQTKTEVEERPYLDTEGGE